MLKIIQTFSLKRWHHFRSLSWKKKILVVFILLIFVTIIVQVIQNATKKPEYTSVIVERSDITETVSETGNITSSGKTSVYSPTNGVVTEVFVTNGAVVEKDQELFSVESSATEQERQAAQANYLTAVSTLNAAKSNLNVLRSAMYDEWDTFRNLATNDTYETSDGAAKPHEREAAEFQIAQDDWLAAEAKYKDQQTVVSQAQAQVSSTWLLYQATQNATVKAPISGIVANLSVGAGSSVKINIVTAPVTPVLVVTNQSATEALVSLSETDIAKVRPDQRVTVEVNAVNSKQYKGIVRRVDDIGTDTAGVVRYNVYVEVLNADDLLRSGMTVDLEIVTNTLSNVLSVPNAAVKPYQGGRAVRVFDEKTEEIVYIPVEIGIRGEDKTQILEGLSEGQEIITALSNEQLKRPGLFGM